MHKRIGGRAILILLATLFAAYYLLPGVGVMGSLPSLLPGFLPPAQRMNLGLDLQGGMYLVLRVQSEVAVGDTTKRQMQEVRSILERDKLGIASLTQDGNTGILLQVAKADERDQALRALNGLANFDTVPGATPDTIKMTMRASEVSRIEGLAVRQSLNIIRNRIDQFGVTEPNIVPQGPRRIVVELPGIRDPQRAINLIGKTAQLELKLVDSQYNPVDVAQGKVKLPPNLELLYEREGGAGQAGGAGVPIIVDRQPILTGSALTSADVRPGTMGSWVVAFTLDSQGAKTFSDFTGSHIGSQLAIVLDNTVYSAPVIQSQIGNGSGEITGDFTPESARDLAIVLRAGALPAPVKILANETVGPSLGQDSIRAGIHAAFLAAVLVILLMGIYYKFSGVIADFALTLNLVMLMGLLALFRATLTLPGIAGIALGVGMAVDSNVLILERIREELKLGKTVRSAIDGGYDKAFVTIVDSHVTTLITAVALFLFGTGPVKGFAVTLSLGVAINLFTALVGTRLVYDWLTTRRGLKQLSI